MKEPWSLQHVLLRIYKILSQDLEIENNQKISCKMTTYYFTSLYDTTNVT